MYRLLLTQEDIRALNFSKGRYGWADLSYDDPGWQVYPEHEMWLWKEKVDEDDCTFPCLNPESELYEKLNKLYDSIV